MESIAKTFAKNLRLIRKRLGMTQEELAEKNNVALLTIQGWESLRRWPKPDSINELAKALNVNPTELFINAEEKANYPDDETREFAEMFSRLNASEREALKGFCKMILAGSISASDKKAR